MSDERDPEAPAATLVERTAEVDAGLVDGQEAGAAAVLARRAELAADPRHAGVVDALAATRAEMASAPSVPMPSGAAGRWTALVDGLHDEPAPAPVVPLLRRRTTRMFLAVAAALVVVATAVGVLVGRADSRPDASGIALVGTALSAREVLDVGELADPVRRAACLAAVAPQVRPDAPLIGGRLVRYDGTPGILLLLGSGRRGDFTFTVAVVDDSCQQLLILRNVP